MEASLAPQGTGVPQRGPARAAPPARGRRVPIAAVYRLGRALAAIRVSRRGLDLSFRPRARGAQLWRATGRARFGWHAEGRAGWDRARIFMIRTAASLAT